MHTHPLIRLKNLVMQQTETYRSKLCQQKCNNSKSPSINVDVLLYHFNHLKTITFSVPLVS